MYRCFICQCPSDKGTPMKKHITYRTVPIRYPKEGGPKTRQEVASEQPICAVCHRQIEQGRTITTLLRQFNQNHPAPLPEWEEPEEGYQE